MTTNRRTAAPAITDPTVTLERCFERLYEANELLADFEAHGWAATAKHQRRKIAGIKATITRCNKMLGA